MAMSSVSRAPNTQAERLTLLSSSLDMSTEGRLGHQAVNGSAQKASHHQGRPDAQAFGDLLIVSPPLSLSNDLQRLLAATTTLSRL